MSGIELAGLVLNAIDQVIVILPEGRKIRAGDQGKALSTLLHGELSFFRTNIEDMLGPIPSLHVSANDVLIDERRVDWASSELEAKLRDFYGRSYKHVLSFNTQTGSLVNQISELKVSKISQKSASI